MSSQRNRAAFPTSAAVALLGALALPGVAGAGTPRPRPTAAGAVLLPAPTDVALGDAGRAAADPQSVLDAYAPSPDISPAGTAPGATPPLATAPKADAASPSPPAAAAVRPPASDRPVGGAAPAAAPAPSAALDVPVYGPPAAELTPEAAALSRALDDWVGPEPLRGLRSFPAAVEEERRHDTRAAVRDFYAARDYAPLWISAGQFDSQARSVLSRIDRAAEDGLDLRSVPVTVPKEGADADALAGAELSLTEAAVEYARQATGGRVDPSRIGPSVAARPQVAAPGAVLAALRDAGDAGDALRDFNPPHRGYALLRDKLAELRRGADQAERAPIPGGPALRLGMRDPRVPLVRARFGLDIAPGAADGDLYDTRVASAVADWQRQHGMPISGVLTPRTVASLSGGRPKRLEDEIIANMERWRWLPRDLGSRYVAVNIPDFSLDVFDGGRSIHHARVVVGKPDHETPVFSDTIKYIIVNPYWNVPLSIVKKEMMPKLAADPNYFADHGYEVVDRGGQTYVRQPPGDSNALGRIKFLFPNRFSVYLHDTNAKSFFARDQRALSHGCVRVDRPFKLAEVVLGRDRGWSEARLEGMVGGAERTIDLPRPVAVHLEYFTAFVDENGQLRLRDDLYGYSAKVRAALGLSS